MVPDARAPNGRDGCIDGGPLGEIRQFYGQRIDFAERDIRTRTILVDIVERFVSLPVSGTRIAGDIQHLFAIQPLVAALLAVVPRVGADIREQEDRECDPVFVS